MQPDTIVYDVNKIAAYQANGRYDYLSQKNTGENSLLEQIAQWFNDLLRTLFNKELDTSVTMLILVCIAVGILTAIVCFIYKRRPELFMRARKTKPLPCETGEENIHEIDFDTEMAVALEQGDYRLAVRLLYLQTLRFLSDAQLIDWQIHKTPSEYLYETKDREWKPYFRELTGYFLQVRYGNYAATAELYGTALKIQGHIIKKLC